VPASDGGSSAGATHELVEHVAEVRVRLRAPSYAGLVAEAGRALGALALRGRAGRARPEWREVEVSSADRAALLVDWINELVFLAERDLWVPTEFQVECTGPAAVRARARGVELDEAPALVKAATFDRLTLQERDGMLEAEVTLDV